MPRFISAEEMREIDRLASEKYQIPSLRLMENAGEACAREMLFFFKFRRPVIFCSMGNNGGDGLVMARLLAGAGYEPAVIFFQNPRDMKPDVKNNFSRLQTLPVRMRDFSCALDWNILAREMRNADILVDALFGTGLSRPLASPFPEIINLINTAGKPVLAVDIPSGLNADSGEVMGAAVRADLTVTLGLPKKAFAVPAAQKHLGMWVNADIFLPRELLA